jgi:O-antigen ligase/tetratricopeptide (TPR) repeat protein
MADNQKPVKLKAVEASAAETLAHKVLVWWLPILYLLISSLFYLRTYDSAQVKITVMQMGGLAALALWVCRLVEAGKSAFSKDDLVSLSPFLAYLGVGIFSFLHAPYHMASVDFFLRHFFFMTAALIVIYEFSASGAERLTKILIWTGWIAIGYGFLQFVDVRWFPPGVGKGVDPFVWRGAFGTRVFSTYGNPNFFADFLVIVFPILLTQWYKTRSFNLIILMAMLLVDLIATGTKGAWVGFGLVIAIFGVIAFTFFKELVAPVRKAVLTVVTVGVLGFFTVVAKDLSARMVSVNFRLFTWEATWEMIMTHPLIGTGVGSFPPIYPAFRRPPIFHIEGKHNTETDHSEDEYIEQLFDNGILGFGIFIWMVFSSLFVGFRSLRQLTTTLAPKDGKVHPRALDLVGYMVAFMGMLGHNFFDVSMRFVSSGVYLGLLSGMIVNLARGRGLYELHAVRPPSDGKTEPSAWDTLSEFLIWPCRLAAWGALAFIAFRFFGEFNALQGPVARLGYGGEVLQWWMAWGTFSACVLGLAYAFARICLLSQNPAVSLVVLGALPALNIFWGYFKADVHHNVAIYFSKERNWEKALENYFIVEKLNPNFVMSLYFEGNVFNDRFDMRKIYNPAWGDKDNVARDDYERAMDAYEKVRKLAPNYVQMHHQVGALHMKRAEWASQQGRNDEAQLYMDRAMTRFRMYEAIDPVFPPNYYRMAQVYQVQRKFAEAAKVYEDLIKAERCAVAPSLISNPRLRTTILSYQGYVEEPGLPYPVHRHESIEAYVGLGNTYFLMEEWEKAEKAYKRGLILDPNNDTLKKNLGALYSKMQQAGRLEKDPSPPPVTKPYYMHTGWIIKPKR